MSRISMCDGLNDGCSCGELNELNSVILEKKDIELMESFCSDIDKDSPDLDLCKNCIDNINENFDEDYPLLIEENAFYGSYKINKKARIIV